MLISISLNNSTVLVLVNGKKFELTRTRTRTQTRTRRFWTLKWHKASHGSFFPLRQLSHL